VVVRVVVRAVVGLEEGWEAVKVVVRAVVVREEGWEAVRVVVRAVEEGWVVVRGVVTRLTQYTPCGLRAAQIPSSAWQLYSPPISAD
jgi:hypothetical protein